MKCKFIVPFLQDGSGVYWKKFLRRSIEKKAEGIVLTTENRKVRCRDKSLPAPPYRMTCQQEFDDSFAKLE